jgi:glycosyltransferase involved in cell wall biosynthesis
VGEALAVARARLEGLRIIVDGSCLMPQEMGTQVAFLEQVEALAERDDVAYLGVALAGPVPPYAQRILSSPKVDARLSNLDTLEGFPEVDVVYRSFQVTPGIDPGRWRVRGRRIVTAIQDLIAYEIPGYQDRAEDWFEYRATMKHACSVVDGVVTISQHTADTVSLERLGVDPSRVFVVPDGIGHLSGDEEVVQPQGLLELGFAGEAFLLVLGTNYSHKNRDLAISVVRELQLRGRKLSLVLAGASVPRGSSGAAEEAQRAPGDGVIVLSDVSSAERNWLFRHAELVLYPTGAEGFGFVPHEAAAFGTPTVMVPIPALAERMPSLPVAPRDWSTAALADACEEILSDPAIAAAQIKAIESGEADFNWQRSAGLLLDVFRSLLARPAVASL